MIKTNIEFKSVLSKYTDINKKNKHFQELTDEGKRLEIAWDCLQLIIQETVKGSHGYYWNTDLKYKAITLRSAKELHLFLNYNLPNCEVCARGGMMLSQIRLGNNIKPSYVNIDNGNANSIEGFSMYNFIEMELEYENNRYNHPYDNNTTEKLANICCNVLVNGNFNIKDTTNYLIN